MSNGWSGGISDDRARNRTHRAQHHRARNGTQGSITATPLGQRYRWCKRQKYRRSKDKPFHIWFPLCILIEHVTPELRPNDDPATETRHDKPALSPRQSCISGPV
jgi:hypothetical protein